MGRKKKQVVVDEYLSRIASMSDDHATNELLTVKDQICTKAKAISQQREAKKESAGAFNAILKELNEEQEVLLVRKAALEDHLKQSLVG